MVRQPESTGSITDEVSRLRSENLVLRARVVQLTSRLVMLETALGGIKPYKTVKVPADDRFKKAVDLLRGRNDDV